MFLLDTDHVSLDQRGHPLVHARIQAAGPPQVVVSVITVEEQMRGWLAAIRAASYAAGISDWRAPPGSWRNPWGSAHGTSP
jgi:hypothetical protein